MMRMVIRILQALIKALLVSKIEYAYSHVGFRSLFVNEIMKLMINHANQTLQQSYSPYSHYKVGACLCSEDGTLFTGTNVENSSYGLTICAESSAICQMISAGKRHIKSMVIMAFDNKLCSPCGACRQRIYEFSTSDTLIYLCNQNAILQTLTVDELLPLAFTMRPQEDMNK